LNPGEYRLYSDIELPAFKDLATNVSEDFGAPNLQIYPNPVDGNLHLEASERIQKVELYTIDGKRVYQSTPNSNRINIDFKNSETGIYIIRIFTANQLFTKKIVKN
jgi:hypothetical protein